MSATCVHEGVTLSALLDGFAEIGPGDDREVSDLTLDSRTVQPGACFVALGGTRVDGLAFAGEARARGAAAILAERDAPADDGVPVIVVPRLRERLGGIADRFFDHPSAALAVFAVTGTNGKTTVAYLVAQAIGHIAAPCGYLGTLGGGCPGELETVANTTPDVISVHRWLARFRAAGCAAAALEASSHALDQQRLAGVRLAAAAFTNLGHDHLDYHGDLEAYAAAKRRLFVQRPLSAAVINVDDATGAALAASLADDLDLWTCSSGAGAGADAGLARVTAADIRPAASGISFDLAADGQRATVRSRLVGRFNVDNLLLTAAMLLAAGHPFARVAAALERLEAAPGRMQRCGRTPRGAQVFVDYAHGPDSLAAALTALRELTPARLHVVFGCGGNRDRSKRAAMGAAAAALADRVVITSDNPRDEDEQAIAEAILGGMPAPHAATVVLDRGAAIALALHGAARGDVVLVAGKGHETTQERAGRFDHFDDRETIARLLAEDAP